MASVINVLAEQLKELFRLEIIYGDSEMLVSVPLPGSRKQIVKLTTVPSPVAGQVDYLLRFQSRACTARNAAMVASSLEKNCGSQIYGFGLDTSVRPEAIDLLYHCSLEPADVNYVYNAIIQIASRADSIERRTGAEDVF